MKCPHCGLAKMRQSKYFARRGGVKQRHIRLKYHVCCDCGTKVTARTVLQVRRPPGVGNQVAPSH